MAKSTKRKLGKYHAVAVTHDGVTIVRPKSKPTHFTNREIRTSITDVIRAETPTQSKDRLNAGAVYVEKKADGSFEVRRQNAKRASAVKPTQREAIERAHEIAPDKSPLVRRVRTTSQGAKGQWRKD